MRFSILMMAILAVTFIYVSCNKHMGQKTIAKTNKVLVGWENSYSPNLHTQLTFDEMHNVIREETSQDISSYDVSGDNIIITEFNKDENRYVYEFNGKLDNQRRLIRGVATSSYIPSAPDTVLHLFEYSKEGYLLTETRVSSSSDTFRVRYEYEDNRIKKVLTYSDTILFNTKEFSYYDDELHYSLPQETKFRKNINHLVGRSDQHMVKQVVSTARKGKAKHVLNFEYEMDSNGYVCKRISKNGKKIKSVVTFRYDQDGNNSIARAVK